MMPRLIEQTYDGKNVRQWRVSRPGGGAAVTILKQGRWHPYRRSWATKRKHQPDADVMEAGGWKSAKVLKTIYQQSDDATLVDVIENPRRLEEKRNG